MFTVHLGTKFHTPSSKDSHSQSNRTEKKKFARPPSCYFTLYNEIIFNKRCLVVEHHYHTLVHKSKLIPVTPSSKIRATIMFLLFVRNWKVLCWSGWQWCHKTFY